MASAGFYAGYALGSDGKVYAWGDNYSGELGVGSTTDHSTPVQVSLPAAVTPTAIGGGNSPDGYAIGSDGHLYAWGATSAGQLGDGTDTGPSDCNSAPCSATPVQVSLPSGVTPTAVAGAAATGYAIGSNGHLYAWGDNSVGEFGDGNLTGSSTPVQVPLPSGSTPQALGSEPDSVRLRQRHKSDTGRTGHRFDVSDHRTGERRLRVHGARQRISDPHTLGIG